VIEIKSSASRRAALLLAVAAFGVGLALLLPNVYERASWNLRQGVVNIWHTLNPQLSVVPTPQVISTVSPTLLTPVAVNAAPTLGSPATAAPAATPLPALTPPPPDRQLTGFTHIWQKVNNCGPATLAMNLAFWGWKGTQANTATALKPDPDDRNVSPHEMADYARSVGLGAEVRVGGTLDLIKQFVSAGIPIILEKGIVLEDAGWEGHYTLITGYSDAASNFTTQDSLQGANFQVPYYLITESWRAFNYTYIVVYPAERQADVFAILGPDADAQTNFANAANRARGEIPALNGQDLAFAWFNLGSSLNNLGNAADAAAAFDQARVLQLPWRMLWYQFGPFEAYDAVGRSGDVLALTDSVLSQANNYRRGVLLAWPRPAGIGRPPCRRRRLADCSAL